MKIALIGNSARGMYNFRGKLIRELKNRGHNICLILPDDHIDTKKEENHESDSKVISVKMDRRSINPVYDLFLMFQYYRILKKEKPDYVITYTVKPNIYAGIVCRILKIPFAANITGLGTAFQSENLVNKVVVMLYKISIRKANVVFFENSANRDTIVEKKILDAAQTHVLNGAGVDLDKFYFSEYPSSDEFVNFLFMGRIMKEKGVNELLESMSRLYKTNKKIHLDMLGNYEESYEEILNKCEKEGWLSFHGVKDDVRPFIKNCHCFILPSWHEGMANTNLECAAMGRPVITSNINGCLEAVDENKSGYLCEVKNADSIYDCLNSFLSLSYEEKVNMGRLARKHVETKFDKKLVVEETINTMFS